MKYPEDLTTLNDVELKELLTESLNKQNALQTTVRYHTANEEYIRREMVRRRPTEYHQAVAKKLHERLPNYCQLFTEKHKSQVLSDKDNYILDIMGPKEYDVCTTEYGSINDLEKFAAFLLDTLIPTLRQCVKEVDEERK